MTSLPFPGQSAAPPAAQAATAPERPMVLDYGDPAAEYAALRTAALIVDRSRRERWSFRGSKARETLGGLVTNDIAALAPGHGMYAAALTAKGKIVADLHVLAVSDPAAPALADDWLGGAGLLVDVAPRAADGWEAIVRKYVNPRVTPYRHETAALRAFGVFGLRARDAIADVFGVPPSALAQLAPYAHARVDLAGTAVLVVRIPDAGLDGFEVVMPAAAFDAMWNRVLNASAGVVPGGQRAFDIARIEAGRPEWGVDMDEATLSQEANLDELHAISYTKGCYTGQEVVARVHFRGHVNRHLRGLAYLPSAGVIPTGAQLVDDSSKLVGDVRSSALSPRLGGVALGMVRREIPDGAVLRARWEADGVAGEGGVTVTGLPFPQ